MAEVGGAVAVRRLEVRPGPVTMQILSGLYSDPIWAVVREYGTNMLDAYVGMPAGAPIRPPQIVLPSAMHPQIVFRDFGRGMPFAEAWSVLDYNASTKTGEGALAFAGVAPIDPDRQVGGYGLGAKVAYCYAADQVWTVESRFGGEAHVFHAFKDAEGYPALAHMATRPTAEPNGVTVTVPVRREDFGKFKAQVERLALYFPMELDLVGAERPPLAYVVEGDGWGVRTVASHERGTLAVMGNVPYPVVARDVLNGYGVQLELRVPIGACDLAPNREALMYTPRTEAWLDAATARVKAELPTSVERKIADRPTAWAALGELRRLVDLGLRTFDQPIKWRGVRLDVEAGLEIPLDRLREANPAAEAVAAQVGRKRRRAGRADQNGPVTRLRFGTGRYDSDARVYIDDVGRGRMTRLRRALGDAGEWTRGYAVSGIGDEAELVRLLHGHPVAGRLSDVPMPAPKRRRKSATAGAEVLAWTGGWQPASAPESGVFVRLSARSLVDYPKGFEYMFNNAALAGVCDRVFGVTRGGAELERAGGWREFRAAVAPQVRRLLRRDAALLAEVNSWTWAEHQWRVFLATLDPAALPRGIARRAVEATRRYDEAHERLSALERLAGALGIAVPARPPGFDAPAAFAELTRRFPLLWAGFRTYVPRADIVAYLGGKPKATDNDNDNAEEN
jgi:hypothetical protein